MKTLPFIKELKEAGWTFEGFSTSTVKHAISEFVSPVGFMRLQVSTNYHGRIKELTYQEDKLVLTIYFFNSPNSSQHYPIDVKMFRIADDKKPETINIPKKDVLAEFDSCILHDGCLSYLRLKYAE